jgi:Family of unknown function (DUF5681)
MEVKMSLDDAHKDDIADDSHSDGDQIGPGQPPKDRQFKKGVSGNPKGRPKKARKSHDFLWDELRKPVKFISDGKVKQVPRLQIVYRQLQLLAVAGNSQASKLYSARRDEIIRRKNNYKEEEDQPVVFEWTEEDETTFQKGEKWERDRAKAAEETDDDESDDDETDKTDETGDEMAQSNSANASSPSRAPMVDASVIAQPVISAETLGAASAVDAQIPIKLSENNHD